MNVFDLREAVVEEFARFSRSYSEVRTPDIRVYLEGAYAHGRFWPVPLIQLNPSFVADATVQELAG